MLNYQSVLLAIFPAVMFLIGKELHGRLTGLFVASIAIMQEFNAINLMDEFPLVSTKVLLSEPYMQLWNALIVLSVILALKKSSRESSKGFLISGGVLGLSALFRLNTFVVIPFILLIIFMKFIKEKRILLQSSLLFILGVFLALSPWMVHNTIVYDDPFAFINAKLKGVIINNRFDGISPEAENSIDAKPVIIEDNHTALNVMGTSVQYASYTKEIHEVAEGFSQPNAPIKKNIDFELNFADQHYLIETFGQSVNKIWSISISIFRHFLNNIITSFSILPVSLVPQDLFHGSRAQRFWEEGYNANLFVGIDFLSILGNLIIIALGITTLIRNNRKIGLVPTAVYLGYHLSNGIAISSGNRYTQPASWMVYLYYAVGLLTISNWFIRKLNTNTVSRFNIDDQKPSGKNQRINSLIGLLVISSIFFFGLSPVIADTIPPDRFQINPPHSIYWDMINNSICDEATSEEELDVFCSLNEQQLNENYNLEFGRIFIPLLINSLDYQIIFTPPTDALDIDGTFYTFMFSGQSNNKPKQLIFITNRVFDNVKNGSDVLVIAPIDDNDSINVLCIMDTEGLRKVSNEVIIDGFIKCYLSTTDELSS
jgi:hypothetical protein